MKLLQCALGVAVVWDGNEPSALIRRHSVLYPEIVFDYVGDAKD